jgi:hypothetical protein
MVIVWTMAAAGIFFTFGLAAVRAAEENRLQKIRAELEQG